MADMHWVDFNSSSIDVSSKTDGLQGCLDKRNYSPAPSTVDAEAPSGRTQAQHA